ncbi:MAG: 3-deoxy-D-manno-octulosonic acid transferase [Deltaproteobacteria bacterium]|nr:3-deoxy-D-manno-octulosonic acid transferase [Deltaproteobacteria bacterium]
MAYWLYNLLISFFFIVSLPIAPFLLLCGRRFREGFLQRLGFYPREICQLVGSSRPIWIHAVSVGEVLSVRQLAGRLKEKFPGHKILLSTFTATGNEIARQNAVGDAVIFLPLDYPWMIRRALKIFDPSLLVFLETEIWPNLLRLAHRRGIPTLLLSGRLSPGSFRRYFCFRLFFSEVVRHFTAVGMQSRDDAERIIRVGCDPRRVSITGSLKHAFQAGEREENGNGGEPKLPIQRGPGRQVLVAGSTHRGEEEILVDVFLALKDRFPALLMVLAPRHPQRFYEVERLLERKRVAYEKKSQINAREDGSADVIFLDTLGELSALYAAADVAFIGGSLVNAGGHNLMEPARFGKPVVFGPYMTNFADIAEEMKKKGGGIEVRGREDLVREISGLLADRAKAESVGKIAQSVVERDRGVVERSIGLVSRYMHP